MIFDISTNIGTTYTVNDDIFISGTFYSPFMQKAIILGHVISTDYGFCEFSVIQTVSLIYSLNTTIASPFTLITNGSFTPVVSTADIFFTESLGWNEIGSSSNTLTISFSSTTSSDMSFNLEDYTNFDLVSDTTITVDLGLSCSISGSTLIGLTLGSYNGGPIPTWANWDSNNLLVLNTPLVTVDTYFTFVVEMAVTSLTAEVFTQTVYLKVNP